MSLCKPRSSAGNLREVTLLPVFALALAAIAYANIWDVKPFLQWTSAVDHDFGVISVFKSTT